MENCPICNIKLKSFEHGRSKHVVYIECIRCGSFSLTELALHSMESYIDDDIKKSLLISYGIRQIQKRTDNPEIGTVDLNKLLQKSLPTVKEQSENIIKLIRDKVNAPGEGVYVSSDDSISIVGASSSSSFGSLLEDLVKKDIISGDINQGMDGGCGGYFKFTVDGWVKSEEILNIISKLDKAFMAMDFKNPIVEQVYKEIYKPLCENLGYDLSTVSRKAGIIDNTMREQIKNSKFLVADLTDDNNGAYWEAGFAEGFGIPVVYCCEKNKFSKVKTHFDTNHLSTACWLIDDVTYSIEQLKDILVATFPNDHEN